MTDNENIEIEIPADAAGSRLDKALATLLPDVSRARIQQIMAQGGLLRAGEPVSDGSKKVRGGERYTLAVPAPIAAEPEAEDIPLDIVHEDKHLIVLDKPVGLVVHPAAGNWDGTLVNALLGHCPEAFTGIGGVERPGIVHRIDKDTSGLMVVAKTERAQLGLSQQFADHSIDRIYTAFVWGVPHPRVGRIEGNIGRSPTNRRKMALLIRGGKTAATNYNIEADYGSLISKLTCQLETGRTHQIRVHLTSRTHPLLGDTLYGKGRRLLRGDLPERLKDAIQALPGQALHAGILGFKHPVSGEEMRFESPLPSHLVELEAALGEYI